MEAPWGWIAEAVEICREVVKAFMISHTGEVGDIGGKRLHLDICKICD
jgi:hypothetical protein